MHNDYISLTELDFNRLNSLVEQHVSDVDQLEHEMERARLLDFPEVPPDLVTMNSRFQYLNLTDNKISEITLVYPHQSNPSQGLISVTAPLGAALLGLREEDEIDWTFPDGKTKRLRVVKILYQPEACGDLHL